MNIKYKTWIKRGAYAFFAVASATYVSYEVLVWHMDRNKVKAKAQIALHIESLTDYLNADRMYEHEPFLTFIDDNASTARAGQLLVGLRNMYEHIDRTEYKISCVTDQEDMAHYGYVYKSGYPVINFCNLFEYMINGGEFWFYHEMSHYYPPYGLATNDEIGPSGEPYSQSDALYFAINKPWKAMSNAYSIEQYLLAEAPVLTSKALITQ